jgi:hypothetical protein
MVRVVWVALLYTCNLINRRYDLQLFAATAGFCQTNVLGVDDQLRK